jgi:hypothetical protein
MSIIQKLVVKLSNTFVTSRNNIVEVFKSLTTSFCTMDTPVTVWTLHSVFRHKNVVKQNPPIPTSILFVPMASKPLKTIK